MSQNQSVVHKITVKDQRLNQISSGLGGVCCFLASLAVSLSTSQMVHAQPADTARPSQQTSASRWQRLVQRMSLDRSRSSSRASSRGDLCQISPRPGEVLWHRRPILIWQGRDRMIALQKVKDHATNNGQDTLLWQTTATYDSNLPTWTYQYDGPRLSPGQKYHWNSVTTLTTPNVIRDTPFTVMNIVERFWLERQLKAQLTGQKEQRTTEIMLEEKALIEASFFAENHLYSDAIKILLNVESPSPLLQKSTQSILSSWSQSMCR